MDVEAASMATSCVTRSMDDLNTSDHLSLTVFRMTCALVVKIVFLPALRESTGLALRSETLPCSLMRLEMNSSPCTAVYTMLRTSAAISKM